MNKATKFAVIVVAGIICFLYLIQHTQIVTLDWNGMFNGTLQGIVGGFVSMALTIVVYRYLYHRGSKN